jgi:hypothetical protein
MYAYRADKISELDDAVRVRSKAVERIKRTTVVTLEEAMRRIERAQRGLGPTSRGLPPTARSTPSTRPDDQSGIG